MSGTTGNTPSQNITTHYRACHLCEAICGLEIKTQGEQIISIKGDKEDPISKGFICPKATALQDLHADPDRLHHPVRKHIADDGSVSWQKISWYEAFDTVARRIVEIQDRHGDDSVAFYAGNPGVHNYGNITHGSLLRYAIGSRNNFSATSLDQLPHHLAGLSMYGHQFFIPIPDIDHTEYLLIIGGNPLASNGSLMTMPDAPGRLKAVQQRGGKVIVIDPRRTETAKIANEHHFIRPGADIYLLLAIIKEIFSSNTNAVDKYAGKIKGLDTLQSAIEPFSLALAEAKTGINSETISNIAKSLVNTEKAVAYGRMGVSVQEHGALCQWAIQVINILIGALDAKGGARITSPAFASVRKGARAAGHFNRFQSRVSGLPEFAGEFPAVAMAEEILTEGDGQIKAMVTIAGNPLVSSANAGELEKAFEQLEFYLAIDFYINTTTRHADIILPPTGPLEHDHFDIAFLRLAVRDSVRFNEAVFDPVDGALHDWEIFNQLSAAINALKGKDFKPLPEPATLIDMGISADMWSEKYNQEYALTLDKIRQHPHGIDLGPLKSGALARIAHDDGLIDLFPELYHQALASLETQLPDDETQQSLLLIGRRHVRSNNSWMHNYHRLVKGKPRWQLQMHPDDLAARHLVDGCRVKVRSRVGEVETVVVATEDMMPGVVSLPHGWGHQKPGVQLSIASQQQGANCNELTDDQFFDRVSGNAALNGVPVEVVAA